MQNFEHAYVRLIQKILANGQPREGRNGLTQSVFGETITIDMSDTDKFPLLLGRRMFPKGILGEFAALIRGPHHVEDFEKFGCNYWKQWADENGYLNLDYGNLWTNFAGTNQMAQVIDKLKNNPADRRMIVSGWNPANMEDLSLPCCHLLYQWYASGDYLDMMWYQRSCDTMIGLPSDIVLAAIWNILLANEVGMKPGKITMVFGDTHIYEEHFDLAMVYIERMLFAGKSEYPDYELLVPVGAKLEDFTPDSIVIKNYDPKEAIKFELKS